MTDAPRATPGWYPDPEMPGTQRYWDGAAWSDHVAPASGGASSPIGRGVVMVTVGILLAVAVVWIIVKLNQPTDVDCALQRADVALGKRAAVEPACNGR